MSSLLSFVDRKAGLSIDEIVDAAALIADQLTSLFAGFAEDSDPLRAMGHAYRRFAKDGYSRGRPGALRAGHPLGASRICRQRAPGRFRHARSISTSRLQ
jgi:hypothetical protein